MTDSDPSSSSPSTKLVLLRPKLSPLLSPSSKASNDEAFFEKDAMDGEMGSAEGQSASGAAALPTIFLDRDFHVVLDDAMRAMASDPLLFAKGDQLVRVIVDGESPRLLALGGAQLREVLSSRARWIKEDAVHPPSSVATALAKRGQWKHVRELRAMTMFPVLSASGELLTEEGYDETTRTFYRAGCEVVVPERPTQKEARAACDRLVDLVRDFPFAGAAHKSAWLAALLTPLARFMHDGHQPLVVLAANMPGSGKSTLAQLIAIIVNGGSIAVMACEKGEPNRKEILSKLRVAPALALIDNVVGRFGGPNMATLLTSRAFEDRSLGHLKTLAAPNDTCWMMTGNRITLAPDMARRCLHVKLQCNAEKPHQRSGFKYPNLMQHVLDHRGALLSDALTILKAYAVAGSPEMDLDPWGSFEEWSRVIRGALVFCKQPDPAATRAELEAESEEGVSEYEQLVLAWHELLTAMKSLQRGATVQEALAFLNDKSDAAPRLRDIVASYPRRDGQPDPNVVARRLREAKDRNFGGKMLQSEGNPKGALRWMLKTITTT